MTGHGAWQEMLLETLASSDGMVLCTLLKRLKFAIEGTKGKPWSTCCVPGTELAALLNVGSNPDFARHNSYVALSPLS